MVAYTPPDPALVAIGAVLHAEPLIAAADRVVPMVRKDLARLEHFGLNEEEVENLEQRLRELKSMLKDKRIAKSDTPLQMDGVMAAMSSARAWMQTLREIASINLCADTPSLYRISSAEPELAEVYPRDVLEELRRIVKAATEMKPRLEEVGLDQHFLGRGRKLVAQLDTALGKKDVDGADLSVMVRRFYVRKAQVYLMLKRATRAGRVCFMLFGKRRAMYHLDEVERPAIEAPRRAVRPKPQGSSTSSNS